LRFLFQGDLRQQTVDHLQRPLQIDLSLWLCSRAGQVSRKRPFNFEEEKVRVPTLLQKSIWLEKTRKKIEKGNHGDHDESIKLQ
jgi:hypothetical protein